MFRRNLFLRKFVTSASVGAFRLSRQDDEQYTLSQNKKMSSKQIRAQRAQTLRLSMPTGVRLPFR